MFKSLVPYILDTFFCFTKGSEMGTAQVLDPMAAAVSDAESASHYFGKVEVSAQFVVLKKGQSKTVWFEGMDTDGRTTEITFRLNPLDVTGLTRMTERSATSNSGEWSRIVWPSLRDLGIKELRHVNGKFAHIEMVSSGREWKNKDGETVKGTTFRFIGLYDLESDCVKAWEQLAGTEAHTPHTNGNGAVSQVNEAEKAAAAGFLPHIVNANKGDLTALANALSSMSPLNKYFTVDSPEVQQLLKAA
jgi:hypothetical protein